MGLMGTAFSERLIDAKLPVVGFDIEAAGCDKLRANGGTVVTSVRELAGRSRTIVIAVYSGEQAEALFGEIEGGAGTERPIVVCTTTCAPDEIVRLSQHAAKARIPFLEAPILGTSAELRDGNATALLDILCPRRIRAGAIGDASRIKLAINLILQNNRAALAEGIAFADLEEAKRRGMVLPMTAVQADLLRAAIALEGPECDSAAVIEAICPRPARSEVSQ
jgi:3-hydroxyisobutyrate dehydrogenase-like beta-hydroxyacid dehydrogenase